MVSPPPPRFTVTLWPDAAMRRAAASLDAPLDVAGGEFAARRAARVAHALDAVARELALMLGNDPAVFEVDVGVSRPGAAPADGTARPPVEVRAWGGDPAPPEVVTRVRRTFEGVWARAIAVAHRARLPG